MTSYAVGFPFNNVTWKPADKWTIEADYWFPVTFNATVSYEVADFATLFGRFQNTYRGFEIEGDGSDDRLFFQQRLLEAGVHWMPCPAARITAAIGYAFDQEFETGWDVRDTDKVRDLSSEPFLRFGAHIRF